MQERVYVLIPPYLVSNEHHFVINDTLLQLIALRQHQLHIDVELFHLSKHDFITVLEAMLDVDEHVNSAESVVIKNNIT